MPKQSKSQWNFGELFEPAATRRVLTVSELTSQVKRLLEQHVGSVWVGGEISNLRVQSSGHIYFTLKDAGAQLNCVLFRGEPAANRQLIQDGGKVLIQGDLTVYEPRGQYQLCVRAVELHGIGALQLAFERLKQKLKAEGLFGQERKRPLPRLSRRIGLVTSPTGAAIRDVLHVIQRRHAALEIILVPCRVQGDGAAAEIAEAIRLLNTWAAGGKERGKRGQGEGELLPLTQAPTHPPTSTSLPTLDLILVTRGGGSLEDLWAFNEEAVARAIFESALPVVSAVGHEIDFTIADFVADVRAATPSAAAEIITEGAFASRQFVGDVTERLVQLAIQWLKREQDNLRDFATRLARAHPRRRLNENLQRLDDLQTGLSRAVKYRWREQRGAADGLVQRLRRVRPTQMLARRRELLTQTQRRLGELARQRWQALQNRSATLETRVRLLSPEEVLARGYSITMDAGTGRVLRVASEARAGQKLKTRLKTGEVRSVVEE